jgi:hypothetical protein
MTVTGLPEGLFSKQTLRFGYIFEGLGIKFFSFIYNHLACFVGN